MNKIMVKSEFAPLKKVVVTQSEFMIPEGMRDTSFLTPEHVERFLNAGGKSYGEVFPEEQKRWEKEREELIEVLESYGAEVLRPRLLTDFEKNRDREEGCSNFFVRDPFFTIGNVLIEGSLRFPYRRNEILPVRDLIMEEAFKANAMYVAVPKPDISEGYDSEKGPFLEGGDVLVYNNHVFVGKSGLASNDNGYYWLKNLMEPMGYTVTQVPLKPDVLHLDCAMSLVREGLMIVSEEALLYGVPELFQDWDKILVKAKEIEYLTINGLPVSEDVYIADIQFKDTVGIELERRGIKVEYLDFAISRSMGGSFRCSTQALVRD